MSKAIASLVYNWIEQENADLLISKLRTATRRQNSGAERT